MTLTNNIVAKLAVAFVAVAMAFSLVAPAAKAQDVSSMSLDELIKLVNQLQSQLSGSAATGSCSFTFTRSLTKGSTGADVMNLQKFLNMSADTQVAASGAAGGPGMETSYFGPATAAAVAKFQTKYSADILVPSGLTSPTGYFGPASMAKANALCKSGTPGTPGTPSGPLKGGAGTLDEAKFMGSLNNEDVGEGQEDVEVVGWEIVPENSDIEITALDLDFDKSNSSSGNFNKYADEVSIWLDGKEIARVDASEFDRDGNYRKTISLKRGAIIRDGDTGEIVVAVSANSTIDSDDLDNGTWIVGLRSVRYLDAQGAYITDSSTDNLGDSNDDTTIDSDERSFTFEDFAAASDMDFKVRNGDSSINSARTIEVSSTSKTTDVALLSFTVEVDGNSDMNLDELTVDATTTNATLQNVVSTAYLYMDDDRVGSESITSGMASAAEFQFDDLDLDLKAGETYEFEIRVDLQKATGSFASGTTIDADISSSDVDNTSKWVVEDEQDDTVSADKRSGSASADAHTFRTQGLQLKMGSVTITPKPNSDATTTDDAAEYRMRVEVTAIGDTLYVGEGAIASSSLSSTKGAAFRVENSSGVVPAITHASVGSFTYVSGGSSEGGTYRIDEGQTATFELVVNYDPTTSGNYRVVLEGVSFGTSNAATGGSVSATPAADFRTGVQFINN